MNPEALLLAQRTLDELYRRHCAEQRRRSLQTAEQNKEMQSHLEEYGVSEEFMLDMSGRPECMSVQWQLLDWKIEIRRDAVVVHIDGNASHFSWSSYLGSNAKSQSAIELVRRANYETPLALMEFPFTRDEPWSKLVMPGAFALRFLSAFDKRGPIG